MHWQVLSTEYLTKHPPYFVTRKDVCKREDGTIIPAYYVVELPASVIVIPMMEPGKVLMVKQYRHPVGEISIEFPGGFVDAGEEPLEAAKREMREETGYTFAQYEYLGKIAANPGVLNNFTHIYLARDPLAQQAQQLDGNEEIALESYTIEELINLLRQNRIIQALHANASFLALLHLGKLAFVQSQL
jgi:8-oxo-dGTP pyrophosphatase MutT (NUDIX family)